MLRTFIAAGAILIGACGGGDPPALDGPSTTADADPSAPDADPSAPDANVPVPDAMSPALDADLGPLHLGNIDDLTEQAVCGWWIRCGLAADALACANSYHVESGTLPQLVEYAMEGRVFFDLAAAEACLAAFDTLECSWYADFPDVCDDVFTGPVGDGGFCVVNEECVGDSTCVQPKCEGECCMGQCTAPPEEIAVGGDCSGAPCDAEGWCDGSVCVARAAAGDPCTSFDGCAAGAFCGPSDLCVPLVDEGGSCDPAILAPSGGCRRYDDWCNPATSLCERRLDAGDSCLDAPVDPCLSYAVCDGNTCDARPYAGQPCGGATGACLGDSVCEAGNCLPPPPTEICP